MNNLVNGGKTDFHQLFPQASEQAISLLSRMLTWAPEKRITVLEALEHPFLSDFHDAEDEPDCATPFCDLADTDDLTEEKMRELLLAQIDKIQEHKIKKRKN